MEVCRGPTVRDCSSCKRLTSQSFVKYENHTIFRCKICKNVENISAKALTTERELGYRKNRSRRSI